MTPHGELSQPQYLPPNPSPAGFQPPPVPSNTPSGNPALDEFYEAPTPPREEGGAPRFTFGSFLNKKEMMADSRLPFGALVRPFLSEIDEPILHRPPVACQSCSAYFNSHCPTSETDRSWCCIFCDTSNTLPEGFSESARDLFPELSSSSATYVQAGFDGFDGFDGGGPHGSNTGTVANTYVILIDGNTNPNHNTPQTLHPNPKPNPNPNPNLRES